jgi:hypothetical protein
MQNINFHLAYLLTKHECVIIPGLGAFVVSPLTNVAKPESSTFCPPSRFLGFNPELKHNDGLLANSIVKEKNITYSEALLLVHQYTNNLLERLNNKEVVQIPWVGNLHLSQNNKITFKPALTLSCNASNYGLADISLLNIVDHTEQIHFKPETSKDVIWIPLHRKTVTYVASAAAAVLAMFFIPTPLNNYSGQISARYASVIHIPVKPPVTETANFGSDMEMPSKTVLSVEKDTAQITVSTIDKTYAKQYFIIVASLPDLKSAEATLKIIQSGGFFKDATIIASKERYRIGVNQFENKQEAEIFLKQFRKDNPEHASAWLLGQKVEI